MAQDSLYLTRYSNAIQLTPIYAGLAMLALTAGLAVLLYFIR